MTHDSTMGRLEEPNPKPNQPEEEKDTLSSKPQGSIFDCLGDSDFNQAIQNTVIDRLGKLSLGPRKSVFKQLGARRTSVFQRLGGLLQTLHKGDHGTYNLIRSQKEAGTTLKVNKTTLKVN